jgi:hypothetical protein
MPKVYKPQDGQKYQILCRNQRYGRQWEHCDYAKDRLERDYLSGEYRMAYGAGWEFKAVLMPASCWPKEE